MWGLSATGGIKGSGRHDGRRWTLKKAGFEDRINSMDATRASGGSWEARCSGGFEELLVTGDGESGSNVPAGRATAGQELWES